jgi:hypothetical protein
MSPAPAPSGYSLAWIGRVNPSLLPFTDAGARSGRLRAGGRLVVSVPNIQSLQARLFGPHWFHLDMAHHLHHFTPGSLRLLLARHGFAVERMGFAYPEMEIAGLIQSALNRAGFERDQLFRFIKRDPGSGPASSASTSAGTGWSTAVPRRTAPPP